MKDQLQDLFLAAHNDCSRSEVEQWPTLIAKHFDDVLPDMSMDDLADTIRACEPLPEQTYEANFSMGSFTLFRTPILCLDLYIWGADDGIDVHNHNFWGYFRPLVGKIRHVTYREQRVAPIVGRVCQVDLDQTSTVVLTGASKGVEIAAGNALIHDTVHLETPTVTLCVRSRSVRQADYVYLPAQRLRVQMRPGLVEAAASLTADEIARLAREDAALLCVIGTKYGVLPHEISVALADRLRGTVGLEGYWRGVGDGHAA